MILLLVPLCALMTGCNNGRQLQADIYQRELRMQEDRIYQLEDCVEEYQAIVRGYRMEVAELKGDGATTKSSKTNNTTVIKPLDGGDSDTNLQFQAPSKLVDEAPAFSPTAADAQQFAPTFTPETETLPLPSETAEEAPPFIPQSYEESLPSPLVVLIPDGETAIELVSPVETESAQEAQELGSDHPSTEPSLAQRPVGIAIAIRNGSPSESGMATIMANCRLLDEEITLEDFEGEVSIMLADPSVVGSPKRIARWDYTAEEIQQAWKLRPSKSQNSVIELPLILPKHIPTDRTLEVWVRMLEPNGKKRLANVEAEFLGDPIRLINVEPLAKKVLSVQTTPHDKPELPPEISIVTGSIVTDEVASNLSAWQKARPDRLKAAPEDSGMILRATFESPLK